MQTTCGRRRVCVASAAAAAEEKKKEKIRKTRNSVVELVLKLCYCNRKRNCFNNNYCIGSCRGGWTFVSLVELSFCILLLHRVLIVQQNTLIVNYYYYYYYVTLFYWHYVPLP